jgi:hypothetical protein
MYGSTLDLMEARTMYAEHDRRVQQYLLEREFIKAQAAHRTPPPWSGAFQQIGNVLRGFSNPMRMRSSTRQKLGEA